MLEQISDKGLLIATIIRAGFKKDGIEFFTAHEYSQQLGYMNRPKGYKVLAHRHKKNLNSGISTYEVLYLKSGEIKITLYDNDNFFIKELLLFTGDIILLVTGGHSIEMIENSEVIEIKQGPYDENDKIDFLPVNL